MYTAQFGKRLIKSYTLRAVVAGNMTFDAHEHGALVYPTGRKDTTSYKSTYSLITPVHICNGH